MPTLRAKTENWRQVDPDDVEIGTVIVVQPGEKIPIDGVVESGSSTLNTSALTGESVPRGVKECEEVISGCVNLTGLLKIRTTREFGESTVSRILDLVENSSMKNPLREFYYEICKILYSGSLLQCAGTGDSADDCQSDNGKSFQLEYMGYPCADLPGYQLSQRTGDFHSLKLFRGNRRSIFLRYSGKGLQLSGSAGRNKVCGI